MIKCSYGKVGRWGLYRCGKNKWVNYYIHYNHCHCKCFLKVKNLHGVNISKCVCQYVCIYMCVCVCVCVYVCVCVCQNADVGRIIIMLLVHLKPFSHAFHMNVLNTI